MPKKQYKKNQEELRRTYERHQSIWSRAAGLLGSWLSREPTAVNITDQANEEEEKERQSAQPLDGETYEEYTARMGYSRPTRGYKRDINTKKIKKNILKTKLMKKKYGRKRFPRRNRRRFKRRQRRFKKRGITKKFKQMAYKVERVIGETKFTPYLTKTITLTNIETTTSPTSLFEVADFPAQSLTENGRVGLRINPLKLIVQLSFTNTSVNGNLNPIRVLIFKNNLASGEIDVQDCFEAGTVDSMYMVARFRPGWGKLIHDFIIQPKVVQENEYNVSTDMVVSVEKQILMRGELYINPNTSTEFNKAFIYIYCITVGSKYGTGTSIVCKTKLYYKDA